MSKRSRLQWGIFEPEGATCKNSVRDAFGQKQVSGFAKLAFNGLCKVSITIRKSLPHNTNNYSAAFITIFSSYTITNPFHLI